MAFKSEIRRGSVSSTRNTSSSTPVTPVKPAEPVKLHRCMGYQVVRDEGRESLRIGRNGRLISYQRALRVCQFLRRRGHRNVRVEIFGLIIMPLAPARFK